ncbi:MAG: glycosyltransferase, partial [Candidatus Eremiobacteraeota bacterium]|nr:glycosyltransferase [Candidatus Eremiobacteraeota bacterium]
MPAVLSLAVDARDLTRDHRGIGRYARAVLRRLAARDDIALTLLTAGFFAGRARADLAAAIGTPQFAHARRIPRSIDVVWHPANRTVFSRRGVPNVVTIHDVVPFRYPPQDMRQREHEQAPFLRSAREARACIAVSRFGKREISQVLKIASERITAIYHGVERSFTPGDALAIPSTLQSQEYLLFVGDPQAEPRKNFEVIYEAYCAAWPAFDGPQLAIV